MESDSNYFEVKTVFDGEPVEPLNVTVNWTDRNQQRVQGGSVLSELKRYCSD